jgi:flagellar biosynthesis GTPase FlhF
VADEPTTPTGETTSPAATGAGDAGTGEEPNVQTLSAEELDAQWRNRVSQKDKAHAAEMKALREQQAATERSLSEFRRQQEQARLAGMSEAERVAAERDALRQELEQERQGRVIDTRKARYPHIAAELDDSAIAVMDEGKLASLNARLSGGSAEPPSLIDSNSAARPQNGVPTRVEDMSTEQLKAQLARESDAFAREIA